MRRHPTVLQINTRVLLSEHAASPSFPATLDDVTDAVLDEWAASGASLVWMLGVWQTGERSRQVSLTNPVWRDEFQRVLPDLRDQDVCGSCFAVHAYDVHRDFGGDEALARLRARLQKRGLGLILDFVPNHVSLDHPWLDLHPEFFITGTEQDLAAHPERYVRIDAKSGARILALGRDPYFPGWPDTLQLDYARPELCAAMRTELTRIAARCDGVRCDMAMLVLPDMFGRTWGAASPPFWPEAIAAVRARQPSFVFLAEVYWDLEWTLQQVGFDYTYDKRLYDRLVAGVARPVREHLSAGLDFQNHLARFLENHDEPRAAARFSSEMHRAAAVISFFTPGLRLFQRGQREGRRVHVPTHLGRAPSEVPDRTLSAFYDTLWRTLAEAPFHDGAFQLLRPERAWPGNESHDAFVGFAWTGPSDDRRLVVVNYAAHPSQCILRLPWRMFAGPQARLSDRFQTIVYDRAARDLEERGLYLDLPAWGYHVFDVS
jgi:hypothetical protein